MLLILACPARLQVVRAWAALAERAGWAKLPRYALGASSGGAMALALAQRLPLDGVCSVIMAVPPAMLEAKPGDPASGRTWAHPPAIFVHMARDANTARAVAADTAALKKQARILSDCRSSPMRAAWGMQMHPVCGLSSRSLKKRVISNSILSHCVQGVWTDELVVQPRPLTRTFFSDRSDAVDLKASELIFKALSKAKLLNATGYLVDDPRRGARCHLQAGRCTNYTWQWWATDVLAV